MKILHVCLAAFYIDNYSYQENMLPKFHKEMGHDVEILASLVTFDSNGNSAELEKSNQYLNEYAIPVTRLEYKNNFKLLRRYKDTYSHINRVKPEIIFIHGCQFLDIDQVIRYVKAYPETIIYVDNHADFSNSARNWVSKNILHKVIWKKCAQSIEPYTRKFYGVLPARVDFLEKVYKLPKDKIDLLVMGADDQKVLEAADKKIINETRNELNIEKDDFLIVTGGKIDKAKLQTFDLMKAIKNIDNNKIKLVIFGSVIEELKAEMEELSNNVNIEYIGWINAKDSYKYFAAADLVVFPGRHSVFWEQVAGQGIPLLVKKWEGTTHIDVGGNCEFLYNDSIDEIEKKIFSIYKNNNYFEKMQRTAKEKGKKIFLYSRIAAKSIEDKR